MTYSLSYSITFSLMFMVEICFQPEWNEELSHVWISMQLGLHHSGRTVHGTALLCSWACITRVRLCRTQDSCAAGLASLGRTLQDAALPPGMMYLMRDPWGMAEMFFGIDILWGLNQERQRKPRSTGPGSLGEGSGVCERASNCFGQGW